MKERSRTCLSAWPFPSSNSAHLPVAGSPESKCRGKQVGSELAAKYGSHPGSPDTSFGGLFITRLTWRSDIEPFSRRSRFLHIVLHPERYAGPGRLPGIRCLNLAGAVLILCA